MQRKSSFGDARLLLERNGVPLPGSLEDPSPRMKMAASIFGDRKRPVSTRTDGNEQ